MEPITIVVDKESIKFTQDGKISVLDAIASLCTEADIPALWQSLLSENPELAGLCQGYRFSRKPPTLVTNGEGWDKIQTALFDHLLDLERH